MQNVNRLHSSPTAFAPTVGCNHINLIKMKIASTLLLLFVNCYIFGQSEYRYFEVINGDEKACAKIRFLEVTEMIQKQDFTLLNYIYPKISEQSQEELEKISNRIKLYKNENQLRYPGGGAARILCESCENLSISFLVYQQNEQVIDDLISLKLKIEKEHPFFIDTIIFSDTLILPNEIRENLQVKHIKSYPPLDWASPDCFGQQLNFHLELDENKNPYLNAMNYGYFLKKYPEVTKKAEKMNLPIKASIICHERLMDCTVDLDSVQERRIEELSLGIYAPMEFPKPLLSIKKIEKLNFAFYGRNINRFIIPDGILQMKSLTTISFEGPEDKVVIVELPQLLYDQKCEIQLKLKKGKILFDRKKENNN